jgi:hypothetical protein
MNSQAKLLTRRELAGFERIYQNVLKTQPGFHFQNLFTDGTYEAFAVSDVISLAFKEKFPRREQTRLTVAAHEAGHSVIMAATYCPVGSAEIDIPANDWGVAGRVKPLAGMDEDEPPAVLTEEEMPPKPLVAMSILVAAGGFVAESFVLKSDTRGSYHEKFLVYCQTRYLDEQEKTAGLYHWNHFIKWTLEIIQKNRSVFEEVIENLLRDSELSSAALARLHSNIKQENASLLFK